MTDYTKLVAAVRDTDFGDTCVYCEHSDMCKDADCIILQAADAIEELQQIADHHEQTAKDYWKEACEYKAQLPKRGKWIARTDVAPFKPDGEITPWTYRCSKCGELERLKQNYCPNCGAKMEAQDANK